METKQINFSEFKEMLEDFGHDSNDGNVNECMREFVEQFNSQFEGKDESGNDLLCSIQDNETDSMVVFKYTPSDFFSLGDIEGFFSEYFENL